MSFSDYSLTPGSNTTIAGLSVAEGVTSPASVNNVLRQLAADGKELANLLLAFSHSTSYPAGSLGIKLLGTIDPRDAPYNAVGDGTTNDTAAIVAAFQAASSAGKRVDGGGKTYAVTAAVATITNLHVDSMTLKELAPNTGDPVTITFTASTSRTGVLHLGPSFKVDRSGDGTVGTLNNSAGIWVRNVARVYAFCEVYGNAKGSGLMVDNAILFEDESYVHDMFCSHSGITDDIQHGSWARQCDSVITGGLVRNLGNSDRTNAARARYNRARAYTGCKEVTLKGRVGPDVDQGFDVTGDTANGNTCVKIAGAHADFPYSYGFKFANAVVGVVSAAATIREPGYCGVALSGPSSELINMTSSAFLTGFVQLGGGANGVWANTSMFRLEPGDASGEGAEYPKGVRITGNTLISPNGATTFTVSSDELVLSAAAPLNIHDGCIVRLTTTGTLPSPLATGTNYFVKHSTTTGRIKLATNYTNFLDGVFVTSISGGSGTHTVTAQRDVDYAVYSSVTAYDAEAPNLVYGNNFGTVTERNSSVVDLYAKVTRGSNQSIANSTTSYFTGTAETDPYGIVDLTGGTSSSTFCTAPLTGRYRIHFTGGWDGGTGSGSVAETQLQFDTGSGYGDVPSGWHRIGYPPTNLATAAITWEGRLNKGDKVRVRMFQNDGGSRNFGSGELVFEFLP